MEFVKRLEASEKANEAVNFRYHAVPSISAYLRSSARIP